MIPNVNKPLNAPRIPLSTPAITFHDESLTNSHPRLHILFTHPSQPSAMAKAKEVREGNRPGLRQNRTPRVLFAIEDPAPKPKSTSKRSTVPKTKANTSKPRAKAATAGRVEKKKAPATKNKRTPTVTDKLKGVVEKAVGAIEGKPAKKVCCFPSTHLRQLLSRC